MIAIIVGTVIVLLLIVLMMGFCSASSHASRAEEAQLEWLRKTHPAKELQ